MFISSHWIALIVVGLGDKPKKAEPSLFLEVKWILWVFYFLIFGRKSNVKPEGFLVCVCASDEARVFFEAFHGLLVFLTSFPTALIGLHFQVLDVSPLDTHFAIILLFIMATIVYGIAYVEIKMLPQDDEYLPILRFICLVSGIIAIELIVAIIISPLWLFIVNLCPILILGIQRHLYQQICKGLYYTADLVLNAVCSLFKKIFQLVDQIYDWFLQKFQ